nr:manganese-transporting ATPase [Tanacetum cinerariifolium]
VYKAGKQVLELLISWCDRPQEEATWEAYDLLVDQFLNFCLEDKAFYQEGSNDTIPVKVYTRKKNQAHVGVALMNEITPTSIGEKPSSETKAASEANHTKPNKPKSAAEPSSSSVTPAANNRQLRFKIRS